MIIVWCMCALVCGCYLHHIWQYSPASCCESRCRDVCHCPGLCSETLCTHSGSHSSGHERAAPKDMTEGLKKSAAFRKAYHHLFHLNSKTDSNSKQKVRVRKHDTLYSRLYLLNSISLPPTLLHWTSLTARNIGVTLQQQHVPVDTCCTTTGEYLPFTLRRQSRFWYTLRSSHALTIITPS